MPGILGKKLGMTSVYTDDGLQLPVTVVEAGPCTVIGLRTSETDGYTALQLGFGKRKAKKTNKAQMAVYEKNNVDPALVVKEFNNFDVSEYKVGDSITVEQFVEGEKVAVTGTSKGKGFQGVMKRHGFSGVGGTTHGQKDRLRAPGSIGQSSSPSRVLKGMKMGGRTGNDTVTTKNLKVVKILPEKNIIMIKGAIPGSVNSIIEINK